MARQLNLTYTGFEPDPTPNEILLISNCIGCHTSTGTNTIVEKVPIVFNTSGYSGTENGTPLAGGNFYDVRTDDTKGHNVVGIKGQDVHLGLAPPGGTAMTSQLTCAGEFGCHGNRSSGKTNITGLKGAHHTSDSTIDGSNVGKSYRFLNGILGKEDTDWEQDNINTSHNEYKGSTSSATNTISYLCAECHGKFHTWIGGSGEVYSGTAQSPWLRHPTDIALKNAGEYASYTTYSMVAPVARPEDNYTGNANVVRPGTDIVMCLSCHGAHASPYFKMVRWDYKSWPGAGTGGCDPETGKHGCCNVCHTSKN
jgi:hypothetical protein